jgi:hypothetical protein
VPVGTNEGLTREFMRLSGLAGSMLEGDVLQQTLETDGVSAAKLIQLARKDGVPVDRIDASNVTTALPLLDTADEVKADISDAVRRGWKLVPRHDPPGTSGPASVRAARSDSGSAGFISGTFAGGRPPRSRRMVEQQSSTSSVIRTDPPNTDPLASTASARSSSPTSRRAGRLCGDRPIAVWVRDARAAR